MHLVGRLLINATRGHFPPVDGGWQRVSGWRDGLEAIVGFTGHAVLAVDPRRADAELAGLQPDGFGGALDPRTVLALAGVDGWIDSLDLVLVATGTGNDSSELRSVDPELAADRVRHARTLRDDVRVFTDPTVAGSVVTVGNGIGGLPEISFEIPEAARGAGAGGALIRKARGQVPAGDVVVAAVAPGNAASLRATLAAGFRPVASVQLFRRAVAPSRP